VTTDLARALSLADRTLEILTDPAAPLSRAAVVAYQLATQLNDATGIARMEQLLRDTGRLEGEAQAVRAELARGPSSNPFESLGRSASSWREQEITSNLAVARSHLTQYAAEAQKQLRFTNVAFDLFERTRARVDAEVRTHFADAAGSFAIAYEQLRSDNPENWSLATTASRRLLKALADHVFPARDEPIVKDIGERREQKIQLTDANYRNRLIAFVEMNSSSKKFSAVVGSHLQLLIDRLEAIDDSLNKGVHATISRHEADAYVLYTYLLVGDVLALMPPSGDELVIQM
jgi:hypothetical protein